MSKRKDTDKAQQPAAIETPAAPNAEVAPVKSEPSTSTTSEPVQAVAAAAVESAKPADMPKPVEAVLKAVEAVKSAEAAKSAAAESPAAAPPPRMIAASEQSRSHKFALLAASVAFAGCVGAMAGALAAAVIARPGATQASLAALDLTSVTDTVTALRAELSSIKTSLDGSARNTSAQFAKFNDRLERIDRAQAAPAAQLKQAMDAIERLERRAQASGQAAEATGSVRPQQTAATQAEPPRPTILDGWVVRHVSRGVAVIQGRRMGYIEVETGDVVPGVGRIESIRRQDGRWVVTTSKGLITSSNAR